MAAPGGGTLKSCLRGAREALTSGEPREALKWCKAALKHDKQSYDAYLLVGKAAFQLKEFEQADMAYSRACHINDGALAAWRGLAELHGPSGTVDAAKLADACEHIIAICSQSGDGERGLIPEYKKRLAGALASAGRRDEAQIAWKSVADDREASADLKVEAVSQLAALAVVAYDEALEAEIHKRTVIEKKAMKLVKREAENGLLKGAAEGVDKEVIRQEVEAAMALSSLSEAMESALRKALEFAGEGPSATFSAFDRRLLVLLLLRMFAQKEEASRRAALAAALEHCLQVMKSARGGDSAPYEAAMAAMQDDAAEELLKPWLPLEGMKDGPPCEAAMAMWGCQLLHAMPGHGLGLFGAALTMQRKAEEHRPSLNRRRQFCKAAVIIHEDLPAGWNLLAKLHLEGGEFESVHESVSNGLQAVARLEARTGFRMRRQKMEFGLLSGHAYVQEGSACSLGKAMEAFQRVLKDMQDNGSETQFVISALKGLAMVALAKGDAAGATCQLEKLLGEDPYNDWALSKRGFLKLAEGNLEDAITDFRAAVEKNFAEAQHHLGLARSYWEKGGLFRTDRAEGAYAEFLQAAKLDPKLGEAFRYLGHFYCRVANDALRAQKCYQKAVLLDPMDREAGEALCELMESAEDEEGQERLCRDVTDRSPGAQWAWRRLGLVMMTQKQWEAALPGLQHAVRGNVQDFEAWEALGLAYQRLGRLSASLKAYARVIALKDIGAAPAFACLQSGIIYLQLESNHEAAERFGAALEVLPAHPSALWGMASAMYGRAREAAAMAARAWAMELLEEAEQYVRRCLAVNADMSAAWKLLGDVLTARAELSAPPDLSLPSPRSAAVQAYKRALHLRPWQGENYADLALALHNQAFEFDGSEDTERMQVMRGAAVRTALGGLRLRCADSHLWTVLGHVAGGPALQQHALIRATQLDPRNARAWARLGQLYLEHGEEDLAMRAMAEGRSVDPLLALPWAAMAKLQLQKARRDKSESLLQEAYRSAFYAAQQLPMPALQLGLGLLSVLTAHIHEREVLVALKQCTAALTKSVEAHFLLGLAAEASGQPSMAVAAFQKAKSPLHEKAHGSGKPEEQLEHIQQIVDMNLGRTLLKAGDPKGAVAALEQVTARGSFASESSAWRLYAVALFRADREREAMAAAQRAIDLAPALSEHHSRSLELLLAMEFRAGHGKEAATSALELFFAAPPACQQDGGLSMAALAAAVAAHRTEDVQRLLVRHRSVFDSAEIAEKAYIVLSYERMLQGRADEAGKVLAKALHANPHSIALRAAAGRLLLEAGRTGAASRCVGIRSSDLQLKGTSGREWKELQAVQAAAMAACSSCAVGAAHVQHSKVKSLLSLQRQIREDPADARIRLLLLHVGLRESAERGHPASLYRALQRQSQVLLQQTMEPSFPQSMKLQVLLCASECALRSRTSMAAAEALDFARRGVDLAGVEGGGGWLALARCQVARCRVWAGDTSVPYISGGLNSAEPVAFLGCMNWLEVERKRGNVGSAMEVLKFCDNVRATGGDGSGWSAALKALKAACSAALGDLETAKLAVTEALNSEGAKEWAGVLHLLHGSICLEEMKGGNLGSLMIGRRSILRALEEGAVPGSRALLAEAELRAASKERAGRAKWLTHMQQEWDLWLPEHRPACLYASMADIVMEGGSGKEAEEEGAAKRNSGRMWLSRAVHMNPSRSQYWTRLRTL